jgi:hypothetical protein
MSFRLPAVVAFAALLAGPALAEPADTAPIATAQAAPAIVAVAPPPLPVSAFADEAPDRAPVRDNKVHGFVEAGVGTRGYRHAAVGLDAPLPNGGEVAVAVDTTQFDGGRGHR